MKVKDYFKEAATHLCKFFQRLAQGVYYALRRLFTLYPNPTWAAIAAGVVMTAFIQVGRARAERDECNRENARLQHRLDSLENKEIKYDKTALWN